MPEWKPLPPTCKCGGIIRILLAGTVLIAECPLCRKQTSSREPSKPVHALPPKGGK